MTTFTPTRTAEPNVPPVVRPTPHEGCLAVAEDLVRKQEADRLFEAGVRWFLAVSAAA